MSDAMIERVARALYDATPFKQTEGGYDEQSETYQRMCRALAKAAIAAMREPTSEMCAAYNDAIDPWGPAPGYRLMIDAALMEPQP